MALATAAPEFGELLRQWRQRRKLSQLDLSLHSAISTRHLSFMETGRSKPSREMITRLAESLELPLRECNALLLAAGYAPMFAEQPLESEEMEPVRSALDRFLRAHEPYPAVVVDRHHNLVAANDAVGVLTAGCAPELLQPPANVVRLALHPDGMAPRTINLGEWSGLLLARLRREAAIAADPVLEELYREVAAYPGVQVQLVPKGSRGGIVVPLRLREHESELAFISTLTTFGTPIDITLSELAIEAFYPANAETAMRMFSDVGG